MRQWASVLVSSHFTRHQKFSSERACGSGPAFLYYLTLFVIRSFGLSDQIRARPWSGVVGGGGPHAGGASTFGPSEEGIFGAN